MATQRERVPAIEGWFTLDDEPHLLGTQCTTCGTYFFPRETLACRNPECSGTELTEVPLSRRGRVWSFTDNRYQPPAPYVSPEPFEPYAIAAVELAREKMVVLGQLVPGATAKIGDEVELVIDTLSTDDEHDYLVWKWRPV